MNQIQRHHLNLVVWVGLWGLCGLSHALGFGPVNSRVTMGEGLALTVPVRLERGEQLSDECVSADVYFGDDKVSAFKVDVSLLQGSQGPYAIQVRTTSAVNEPVVTVNVSAGCASRMSRRYVVLADPPGLPRVSTLTTAEGADGVTQAAGKAPDAQAGRPALNRRARSSGTLSAADSRALSMRWAAPAIDTASVDTTSPRMPPALKDTARLLLSGMRLATSMDMPSSVEDNSPEVQARRATATAHWWALQATPSQLALEQARLLDLERRVAELQDWRPPAEPSPPPQSASAPDARPSPLQKGVDPEEVKQIRIIGLCGVALIGLLAWGVQHWRRRAARDEDLRVQEPSFSLPPPSWMAGRR
ncbi:MAG: hypothetical protein RI920_47 [Pseudomonadota bacterium]|jgi:hypothetical protein